MVEFEFRNNNTLYYVMELEIEDLQILKNEFETYLSFYPKIESPIGVSKDYVTFIGGSCGLATSHGSLASGILIPLQPLLPNNNPLLIPISNDVLKLIEMTRFAQQEVALNLFFYVTCHIPVGYDRKRSDSNWEKHIDLDIDFIKGTNKTLSMHSPKTIKIHREKWSQLLQQSGYQSFRLVEIPSLNLRVTTALYCPKTDCT